MNAIMTYPAVIAAGACNLIAAGCLLANTIIALSTVPASLMSSVPAETWLGLTGSVLFVIGSMWLTFSGKNGSSFGCHLMGAGAVGFLAFVLIWPCQMSTLSKTIKNYEQVGLWPLPSSVTVELFPPPFGYLCMWLSTLFVLLCGRAAGAQSPNMAHAGTMLLLAGLVQAFGALLLIIGYGNAMAALAKVPPGQLAPLGQLGRPSQARGAGRPYR